MKALKEILGDYIVLAVVIIIGAIIMFVFNSIFGIDLTCDSECQEREVRDEVDDRF